MTVLCGKIVYALISSGKLECQSSSAKEEYIYVLDMQLMQILYIGVSLLIGSLIGVFFESVLFTAIFAIVRMVSGGYHSKSQKACLTLSSITTLAMMLLVKRANAGIAITSSLLMLIFSSVIVFLLSPVIHQNDWHSEKDIEKMKKMGRTIVLFISLICFILYRIMAENAVSYVFAISLGAFVASLSIIAGKIFQNDKEQNHE